MKGTSFTSLVITVAGIRVINCAFRNLELTFMKNREKLTKVIYRNHVLSRLEVREVFILITDKHR